MRHLLPVVAALLLTALPCCAEIPPVEQKSIDITLGDKTLARTMITPFDKRHADETYKVYTHLLDPAVGAPITKGPGGKFPHHRGLFIGWKDTMLGDEDLDTWHMSNCHQAYGKTLDYTAPDGKAGHKLEVLWNRPKGEAFIREERTLEIGEVRDGVYVADFTSRLESLAGTVQLKGDLQHAGMQVRLSDEVSSHEDTTSYVLPASAVTGDDDAVTGAWWACVSAEVGGKRYSVLHMTPPSNPGGVPVYSIRKYARFGAFFEPTLETGKPLDLHFRVVWSDQPLDAAACQALYDAFAQERP